MNGLRPNPMRPGFAGALLAGCALLLAAVCVLSGGARAHALAEGTAARPAPHDVVDLGSMTVTARRGQ